MTWFEKLYENPLFLAKFCKQVSDSYCWSDNKFSCCMDDLPIFEELGLKQRFGCPGDGDCFKCESRFLFDRLVYELSVKESKKDG